MHEGPLTGRIRYRKGQSVGCYGKLILQVEYSKFLDAYKHWACFWRDAKPEDTQEAVVDLPDHRG